MRKITIIFLLLLLTHTASAQNSDCGSGLPCGPIPWRLPVLPVLQSPTPAPTQFATAAPTYTPGGPPTATIQPTANPLDIDTSGIHDQVATLNAAMASTPIIIYNQEGTPFETAAQYEELTQNAAVFFGYAQGLGAGFGPLAPLVQFTFLSMLVVLSVKATTFLFPLLAAIFGIIRKVVSLILEFIPL